MSKDFDINIKRFIVHILDANLQMPVISELDHPLDGDGIEFIETHIIKILKSDDTKTAKFMDESKIRDICNDLKFDMQRFTDCTKKIADQLFELMRKHVDIPAADLICCLFGLEGSLYLGIFKLNYKEAFSHYVQNSEDGRVNSIVKQRTALPGKSQKVEEAAIINLQSYNIQLVEKRYDINGEMMNYFSELFLNCTTNPSSAEKVKKFQKATEKFNRQYFESTFEKAAEIKKTATEAIEENGVMNIADVAETVFGKAPDIKNAYIEELGKAGLKDTVVMVPEKLFEKDFKTQKIKTDTGIEIAYPVAYHGDKNKIEFIVEADGSQTIVITGIGNIFNK